VGTEIQSLMSSPDGSAGGGDVVRYRFDEADGPTATDASGNGRDATVVTAMTFVDPWPGKVFKHRLVSNDEFVEWKDQQNFLPFLEGLVPNESEYTQALRYYADATEFPIMPFYTSNQFDEALAAEVGFPGSNNFSNINSTLQAQLYARALRDYPTANITPGMYRSLLEWLTWVQYVDGDNRRPNNNEFFFGWNPTTKTFGRSGIHHNILGAYNFMLIDDIAGVRPRLDDRLELWPIDVGWERFAIADLSYHGHDLSLVWDRPGGGDPYPNAPEGFSGYVDGKRVFTLSDLAHLTWNSKNGAVSILDGSSTAVLFKASAPIESAVGLSLRDNAGVVDMFQNAGVDLSEATGWAFNRAEGKPVSASFTTTSPSLRATGPEFAVDGYTISGLPASGPGGQAQAGYLAPNTIWGACGTIAACGTGTTDAEVTFEVDLLARPAQARHGEALLLQRQELQPAAERVPRHVPPAVGVLGPDQRRHGLGGRRRPGACTRDTGGQPQLGHVPAGDRPAAAGRHGPDRSVRDRPEGAPGLQHDADVHRRDPPAGDGLRRGRPDHEGGHDEAPDEARPRPTRARSRLADRGHPEPPAVHHRHGEPRPVRPRPGSPLGARR
jgi:hypothetical protein